MSAPPPDAPRLLAAALEIVAAAAPVATAHFRGALDVERKADESPVTRADRETETRLRAEIAARFPGHGILGEEFGAGAAGAGGHLWVIDPIDGTQSFVSGHPLWGMLLGLLHHGAPVLGVIAMPALGETLAGGPGLGCRLNGRAVAARPAPALADAFLLINELPRILAAEPETAARLLRAGRYRRAVADCYSYVQLAAGWVDAVVDYGLQPYDYLPVLPIVEAAGCVMTDWQGRPLGMGSDGRVVAAPPGLHAELVALLEAR